MAGEPSALNESPRSTKRQTAEESKAFDDPKHVVVGVPMHSKQEDARKALQYQYSVASAWWQKWYQWYAKTYTPSGMPGQHKEGSHKVHPSVAANPIDGMCFSMGPQMTCPEEGGSMRESVGCAPEDNFNTSIAGTSSDQGKLKAAEHKVCKNCGTDCTPFWRKDKHDMLPLCNACGLYYAKKGSMRPANLWKPDEGMCAAKGQSDGSAGTPPEGTLSVGAPSPPPKQALSGGMSGPQSAPPSESHGAGDITTTAATETPPEAAMPVPVPHEDAPIEPRVKIKVEPSAANPVPSGTPSVSPIHFSAPTIPIHTTSHNPHGPIPSNGVSLPSMTGPPMLAAHPTCFVSEDAVQLPSAAELLTCGLQAAGPPDGVPGPPSHMHPPHPALVAPTMMAPYSGARMVQLGTIGPQQYPIVGFASSAPLPQLRPHRVRMKVEPGTKLPPLPPLAASAPIQSKAPINDMPPMNVRALQRPVVQGPDARSRSAMHPADASAVQLSAPDVGGRADTEGGLLDDQLDADIDMHDPAFDPNELEALLCDDGPLDFREEECQPGVNSLDLEDIDDRDDVGLAVRSRSAPIIDPFGSP